MTLICQRDLSGEKVFKMSLFKLVVSYFDITAVWPDQAKIQGVPEKRFS